MKLPAFTIIAMVMLIGCRAHPAKPAKGSRTATSLPTSAPAPVIERAVGSFRPPPAPDFPVKQGPAPLAYLVEAGGPLRIVDMVSGAILATGIAEPRGIVSIDEKAGIRVGRELLVKGPLPSGRTYGIYLENQGENQMRTERIGPGKTQK